MWLVHQDALLKYEDKVPLWPLLKLRNYLGRFISVSFHFFLVLVPLSYFTLGKKKEEGGEGEKKIQASKQEKALSGWLSERGIRCWKDPGPPVNTILLSGNHSLRETK